MANTIQKSEILRKNDIIESTRIQLKKEFIGLNNIIDEIINNVISWYLFPHFQKRPVVINLWGLTGVGKTSIIKRLSQLLNFDDHFFHFYFGNKEKSWSIYSKIEGIYEAFNSSPIIILIDEFQSARTIDESSKEIEKPYSSILWQLLDDGKIDFNLFKYRIDELYDIIMNLKFLVHKGVRVKKGLVIRNRELFIKEMNLKEDTVSNGNRNQRNNNELRFIPKEFHQDIYEAGRELFKGQFEVDEILLQLDEKETIKFLDHVHKYVNGPKIVDCSKSIIFVIGNLDEAYQMSGEINPDFDADEFHEQSLKITIPKIKKALTSRFRSEQIGRLGNIHIIFPAFNKNSYYHIIKLELAKVRIQLDECLKIITEFDKSIVDLIFKEGVYPTQGTRPLFSTIHQLINTKIGLIVREIYVKDHNTSKVKFKAVDDTIIIEFIDEGKVLSSIKEKQVLNLNKLRISKKDDLQAIAAVHESGHAILATLLLNTLPEVIYSKTANAGYYGYVHYKPKWDYISKKEIIPRLAIFLGGYSAEKIIFGEENVTTGAEQDINKATEFVTEMLKDCGMGDIPVAYHNVDNNTKFFVYDYDNTINETAKEWLTKALQLAEKTLNEQELLLLRMAEFLSDNNRMTKHQIQSYFQSFGKDFDENKIINNGEKIFYREQLKDKVRNFANWPKQEISNPCIKSFSINSSS